MAGLLCEEEGPGADNVKYCGYCKHHYNKMVSRITTSVVKTTFLVGLRNPGISYVVLLGSDIAVCVCFDACLCLCSGCNAQLPVAEHHRPVFKLFSLGPIFMFSYVFPFLLTAEEAALCRKR